MRKSVIAAVPLLAAAALAISGCSGPAEANTTSAPATPFPVALQLSTVPKGLEVGVVLSLTSPVGEGSEWEQAAEGAQVAAWQLRKGGTAVTLKVIDDKGTTDGAVAAVNDLAKQHVSAIVFATSGPHLDQALTAASQARIPALLPYGWRQRALPADAWSTGPGADAVQATTRNVLTRLKAQHPVTINVGSATPDADAANTITVAPGANTGDLTAALKSRLDAANADAVVIDGDASQQALVVAAIQGTGLNLPIVFSPDAVSPAFPAALSTAAASLTGNYWTVGAPDSDGTALVANTDGQAVSAFLAAVRLAAADSKFTNLTGDQPFSTAAASADIGSHDALLAIVAAASMAGSSASADIITALGGLTLTHKNGLAGPTLDFAHAQALGGKSVVPLQASTQNAGLRPASASPAPTLDWFAAPGRS
ncbi:MAG: hypothetical protein ABI130_10800 [Leifsonia sp.]